MSPSTACVPIKLYVSCMLFGYRSKSFLEVKQVVPFVVFLSPVVWKSDVCDMLAGVYVN